MFDITRLKRALKREGLKIDKTRWRHSEDLPYSRKLIYPSTWAVIGENGVIAEISKSKLLSKPDKIKIYNTPEADRVETLAAPYVSQVTRVDVPCWLGYWKVPFYGNPRYVQLLSPIRTHGRM